MASNLTTSEINTSTNQPFTVSNGDFFDFLFTVPIAEWAGSGTVNLAQNDVEYASNSSVTNADDTTSYAYGPAGSSFPAIASSMKAKRVRFNNVQPTDVITIEISNNGGATFFDLTTSTTGVVPYQSQATSAYGMGYEPVGSSNEINVYFGTYRSLSSSATYGAAGSDYTAISNNATWKWRVRKTSAGAAVGFSAYVPGVSSGLVPSAGLPTTRISSNGRTTATNIGAYTNIATIPLTSGGTWIIRASSGFDGASDTNASQKLMAISAYSGAGSNDHVVGVNETEFTVVSNGQVKPTLYAQYIVNIGAPQTYYLKVQDSVGTSHSGNWGWEALRI